MRNIRKRAEPNSLRRHHSQQHADYDNYAEKDDLRESLVEEQRGICCYCMQRIRPTRATMKIEHWQCQSRYPSRQLDLLGACRGGDTGERQRTQNLHCDSKKADLDLTYCPANPAHDVEAKIRFLGNGRITSDDPQMEEEVNRVLNLNDGLLVRNRKGLLESFRQGLMQRNVTKASLRRQLRLWNGEDGGQLEPFCQVVVYYLKKKLASA